MKKVLLFMAGLALAGSMLAQSKEELKAQKEAQKEAEKVVKKAQSIYQMSIPNEQYGRKATDFEKLGPARDMIEGAVKNPYSINDKLTWKVAVDITNEYYKKLENEVKADESLKPQFVELSEKLATYCVKYDSIANLDPKTKAEEKKMIHLQHQTMAVNACVQLLQAAQNYSNSEEQADLKLGAKYAESFLNIMEKAPLMSDFTNENRSEWLTYAKAFRAQSYFNLKDTPEDKILEVYTPLFDTKYKTVAFQTLSNYYHQHENPAKQNQYLQMGIDALKGDAEQKDLRANFAVMLMQNMFQAKDKEGFKKISQLIKDEMSDNDNAINAWLMEGQMLFEEQKYDEAKAVFLDAKKVYPDEPKCQLMAARCAWMKAQAGGSKKADMDEAIAMFKQLESENPNDPELWGESLYILYNNTQQPKLAAPYKKYYKQ